MGFPSGAGGCHGDNSGEGDGDKDEEFCHNFVCLTCPAIRSYIQIEMKDKKEILFGLPCKDYSVGFLESDLNFGNNNTNPHPTFNLFKY